MLLAGCNLKEDENSLNQASITPPLSQDDENFENSFLLAAELIFNKPHERIIRNLEIDDTGKYIYATFWDDRSISVIGDSRKFGVVKIPAEDIGTGKIKNLSARGGVASKKEFKELVSLVYNDEKLYLGFDDGYISKIDANTMQEEGILRLGNTFIFNEKVAYKTTNLNHGAAAKNGRYILFGGSGSGFNQDYSLEVQPAIFRVNTEGFSTAGQIALSESGNIFSSATDPIGPFVYFTLLQSNGKVKLIKVDSENLQVVGSLIAIDDKTTSMYGTSYLVVDHKGLYAYVLVPTTSKIVRIDLKDFKVDKAINLKYVAPYSMVIDSNDAYGYIGGSSGTVVRIDLRAFKEDEYLETGFLRDPSFEGDATSEMLDGVMDQEGKYVFFADTYSGSNSEKPARIAKIQIT